MLRRMGGVELVSRANRALRPPLLIHVAWQERAESNARALAEALHQRLSGFRQPATETEQHRPRIPLSHPPGVQLRFCMGRKGADGQLRIPPIDLCEAERHLVVLLIDHEMFAFRHRGWAAWVDELSGRMGQSEDGARPHLLLPVGTIGSAQRLCDSIAGLNLLDAQAYSGLLNDEELIQALLLVCIRMLKPGSSDATGTISVFLSHAKRGAGKRADEWRDLQGGESIAHALRRYLLEHTQARVFFDRNSLLHGAPVERSLRAAIERSALLVVRTDTYLESEWCQLELRLAREKARPIVVVDALERGLPGGSPLFGHAPVVKWEEGIPTIVSTLLQELLRLSNARRLCDRIAELSSESPRFCASPPDLITIAALRSRSPSTLLYPDPPLPRDALLPCQALLPGVRVRSILEHLAFRPLDGEPAHGHDEKPRRASLRAVDLARRRWPEHHLEHRTRATACRGHVL